MRIGIDKNCSDLNNHKGSDVQDICDVGHITRHLSIKEPADVAVCVASGAVAAQTPNKSQSASRRLLNIVVNAVLIAIAAFAIAVTAAAIYVVASGGQSTIFGYSFEVVASGSMDPTISIGDLIVVKEESAYTQGEVVTYRDFEGNLITHRIIGVADDGQFITKGDANNVADNATVAPSQIVGELVLDIPGGEAIVDFARQPIVLGVLVFVLALLILAPLVLRRAR
jgi:signal peptidase